MIPTVLAAASPQALWYLTRGSGVVALVLLTGSVVLGIVGSIGWSSDRMPRFVTSALHRNVSLLAFLFLVIHIVTAELDTFAPVGWLATAIPFASEYRPLWLGFGTLAFDLFVAVLLTSLVRVRLGQRTWRIVHWLVYLSWPLALVHGLGTGTDARLDWVFVLNAVCVAAVVLSVTWRLVSGWPRGARQRLVSGALGSLVLIVIGVWAAAGPLRPGWAARAGTPGNLLAAANTTATGSRSRSTPLPGASSPSPSQAPATPALSPPFGASLSGTQAHTHPASDGTETIDISAQLSQGASGRLHMVIRGIALSDGVQMESSSVTVGPPPQPTMYQGRIRQLEGTSLVAELSGAGKSFDLSVQLKIDSATGSVSGTARTTSLSVGPSDSSSAESDGAGIGDQQ